MINLLYDTESDIAKLAPVATVIVGVDARIRVVTSKALPPDTTWQLALGKQTDNAVLAFTDAFSQEGPLVWTALLDCTDTRLVTYMTAQVQPTAVNLELTVTVNGERRAAPHIAINVQPRIITGPTTSESGPSYYTETETDAAIAAAEAETQALIRTLYFVADGDSRTAEHFASVDDRPLYEPSWFEILRSKASTLSINFQNYGVPSKTSAQILSSYAAAGGVPSMSVGGGHRWSPALTGGYGTYFLWAGINDWVIAGITDATTIVNTLKSIYALARADGYQQIVGFTNPHDGDSAHDTIRAAVNTALLAMTLGGSDTPDVLVRLDLLLHAFDGSNTFADALHLSAYGNKLVAEYVWAKINKQPIPRLPHVAMSNVVQQTIAADSAVTTTGLGAVIDESGLFDSATQRVFCPYTGVVEVQIAMAKFSTADVHVDMRVYKNGSTSLGRILYALSLAGFEQLTTGAWQFAVAAGDTLEFKAVTSGTSDTWTIAGADDHSARFSVSYKEVRDF